MISNRDFETLGRGVIPSSTKNDTINRNPITESDDILLRNYTSGGNGLDPNEPAPIYSDFRPYVQVLTFYYDLVTFFSSTTHKIKHVI